MGCPLVSIIMPAYNAAPYILESIQSVINQTYKNWELIIIDDGSTDQTYDKIIQFKSDRIRIFKQSNAGQSAQLNKGIALARGKYIAIAHADDLNVQNRLFLQVNFLEQHSEIGICGGAIKTFENHQKSESLLEYPTDWGLCYGALFYSNPIAHPTVMIRKSVLEDSQVRYDENLIAAEDYDLWIRLSQHTKICNILNLLVHYRLHNTQTSALKKKEEQLIVNRSRLLLIFQLCKDQSKSTISLVYHFFYQQKKLSYPQQWRAVIQCYQLICNQDYMNSRQAKDLLISVMIKNLKSIPLWSRSFHVLYTPILLWHFGIQSFNKVVYSLFFKKS